MSLRRQWTMIDVEVSGWWWKARRLAERAAEIASKHRVSFRVHRSGILWVSYHCHFEGHEEPTEAAADEFVEWSTHVR